MRDLAVLFIRFIVTIARLFDLDKLAHRLRIFVDRSDHLKPEAAKLLNYSVPGIT